MNADILLQYFDRISEAPDAVPRLRRFILDLAVRGKLVEQDPRDEPASELLKRIRAEKARFEKEKKIRFAGIFSPDTSDKAPYGLPQGWEWVLLRDISEIERGGSPRPINDFLTAELDGLNWIKIGDSEKGGKYITSAKEKIRKEGLSKTRMVYPGDFLLTNSMSFGRPYITKIEGCIHDGWLRIHPPVELDKDYLYHLLSSSYASDFFRDSAAGAVVQNLNADKVRDLPAPLPPLAEQHRIVAKVDELMALCDQLEAARNEREARRQRLTAASLQRLNQPVDAASLRADARFHLDNLTRLTTRPEQIKQLRQTILNLAVRGCLVPQDPQDEPASELLKRIAVERASGRNIQTPAENSSEGLPVGWDAANLSDYALDVCTGPFGSALHQSDYIKGGIPLVNPSHMVNDRIISDEMVSVPLDIAERLSSYRLEPGDVVMARRGEVGRAALVEPHQKGWLCGTGSFYLRFSQEINRHFFLLLLRSTQFRSYLAGKAVGTTMVNLNHNILNKARLQIPPLAEQDRIVARVDELMALCDQLETQLTTTATDSRRLLEAVLRDALHPN